MSEDYLHKHFISQVKGALKHWSGVGGSGDSGGDAPSGGIIEVDILPRRKIVLDADPEFPDALVFTDIVPITLEIGAEYIVELDTDSYKVTANDASSLMDGAVLLGNGSMYGLPGNDEPFAVVSIGDMLGVAVFDTTLNEHDIRIYQSSAVEGTVLLQHKTITENGSHGPDDGYHGFAGVIVNAMSSSSDAVTVTFCNYDGTVLFSRQVFIGDDCPDPVAKGKLDTPIRESDVGYTYSHSGWSLTPGGTADTSSLKNITEDKTVYAAYTASVKYYTATFYDGDMVMSTVQVAYGSKATPPGTSKEGYSFVGWTPSDLTIYGDTAFVGTWEIAKELLVRMESPSGMGTTAAAAKSVYSPDGSKLYVVCGQTLYMYDATTLPYTLLSSCALQTTSSISQIAISPSGDMVALSVSSGSNTYAGMIFMFAVGDSSLTELNKLSTTTLDTTYIMRGLVFDPSGETLYSLDKTGKYLLVINTTTFAAYLKSLSVGGNGTSSDIDISPDGTTLVCAWLGPVGNINGALVDINNDYAANTSIFGKAFGRAQCVAYSPDGKYIAFGSYRSDSDEVSVFDTTTSPYTKVFHYDYGSARDVQAVAFSNDGTLFVFGSPLSPYFCVYNTDTWTKCDDPLVVPTAAVSDISFNHDDTMLALGNYSTDHITLYEVNK